MDRRYILIFIFSFLISELKSQEENTSENFYDAEYAIAEDDFIGALALYEKVLNVYPDNAYILYNTGICLLNIEGRKEEAIPRLIKASGNISRKIKEGSIKEVHAPYDVFYFLGKSYLISNKTDSAIQAFNTYKSFLKPKNYIQIDLVDIALKNCEIAKENFRNKRNISTSKLPASINKDSIIERAILSANNSVLVYETQIYKKKKILVTYKKGNIWSNTKDISGDIGLPQNASISSISADGQRLYLVVSDINSGDIYMSEYVKNRWSKASKLSKSINTSFIENHAAESPDGQTLYFTRETYDDPSNYDIFISKKKPDGTWKKALQAGQNINTILNEGFPFMTPDGSALYFSSEGHASMGGYDVFYAKCNADGSFSEPINLGYPINTTDDDLFYVPLNGNHALYCLRNNNNIKQTSMSNVSYSKDALPRNFIIKGNIYSTNNSAPLNNVNVILAKIDNDTLNDRLELNQSYFETTVKSGRYELTFSAESFETVVKPFTIEESQIADVLEIDASLPFIVKPDIIEVPVLVKAEEIKANEKVSVAILPEITPANNSVYSIQLGAFKYPPHTEYFIKAGEVISHKDNDGFTRFNYGNFKDLLSAKYELKRLVILGYTDAFIVKVQENIASEKVVQTNTTKNNGTYTIQIMAAIVPVNKEQFSRLLEVNESLGIDGYYRYTVGEYKTALEASSKLNELHNSGYKDAFLRLRK